jgi:hypothetical protein
LLLVLQILLHYEYDNDEKYISANQDVFIPMPSYLLTVYLRVGSRTVSVVVSEFPLVVLSVCEEEDSFAVLQVLTEFTYIHPYLPSYLVHIYSISSKFL